MSKFEAELEDAIQSFAEMASHLKLARCRFEASYLSFQESYETSEFRGDPNFEKAAYWMQSIYAKLHQAMEPTRQIMDRADVQEIVKDGDKLIARNGLTGMIRRLEKDLEQYFD